MALTTSTYILHTGAAAGTGAMFDPDKTTLNTIYYRHSGLAAGSVTTFILEARDPQGGWGYIIDTIPLTGAGTVTSIATFSTPITNGIRAAIQNISNASGYVYLDASSE